MKKFLLLAGLLFAAARLPADSFIIYSKGDYSLFDATTPATKPADPARAAFLATARAGLTEPVTYETTMTLIPPPAPAWGKVIPGARGWIKFHDTFPGGFFVHVTLEGLAAGHRYRLCLNGNPKLAGNDLFVDPVPGNPAERYFDFFTATADGAGRFDATFAIALRPSAYEPRFYVKDVSDFTIFLYHDYFKFTIE